MQRVGLAVLADATILKARAVRQHIAVHLDVAGIAPQAVLRESQLLDDRDLVTPRVEVQVWRELVVGKCDAALWFDDRLAASRGRFIRRGRMVAGRRFRDGSV